MRLRRFADADTFLAAAGSFLVAREAEHNLTLGICAGLADRDADEAEPYLAAVERSGAVIATAIRTPPYNLVLSMVEDEAAVDLLVAGVGQAYANLPGVSGPKAAAQRFATLWQEQRGASARISMRQRIYAADAICPPENVPGALRAVAPADHALVGGWTREFGREALGDDVDPARAQSLFSRWVTAPQAQLFVWEDGDVVSMAGASGPTPNGIRIGLVYTPPPLRGRGYASACVAALSQRQLDSGRRFCFLFTDLANPTSNSIYQRVGYRPVCDVDQYRFGDPG